MLISGPCRSPIRLLPERELSVRRRRGTCRETWRAVWSEQLRKAATARAIRKKCVNVLVDEEGGKSDSRRGLLLMRRISKGSLELQEPTAQWKRRGEQREWAGGVEEWCRDGGDSTRLEALQLSKAHPYPVPDVEATSRTWRSGGVSAPLSSPAIPATPPKCFVESNCTAKSTSHCGVLLC